MESKCEDNCRLSAAGTVAHAGSGNIHRHGTAYNLFVMSCILLRYQGTVDRFTFLNRVDTKNYGWMKGYGVCQNKWLK